MVGGMPGWVVQDWRRHVIRSFPYTRSSIQESFQQSLAARKCNTTSLFISSLQFFVVQSRPVEGSRQAVPPSHRKKNMSGLSTCYHRESQEDLHQMMSRSVCYSAMSLYCTYPPRSNRLVPFADFVVVGS